MTTLVIQIPCYNESQTLPLVLASLPRQVEGVSRVLWLVIDDGSTDSTAEVARRGGVDCVVRHVTNRGLSAAFLTGLREAVRLGADIIVNLDGDNQYVAADIPRVIRPILEGHAEIVVGARPIEAIPHFSAWKKALQRLGSRVVRFLSGTDVVDAPSGFRAFSRRAALSLNVFNPYSYTLETIIQAGRKGIPIVSVPVRVNPPTRPSRLSRGTVHYVRRSIGTILRTLMVYRPMRFFLTLGTIPFAVGTLIGIRFVVHYALGRGQGKVQSLILAAILLILGSLLFGLALLADLIAANRALIEKLDLRLIDLEERLGRTVHTGDRR